MEFRAEAIFLALVAAADLQFDVRHDHLRKHGAGTLTITETGIRVEETGKKANEHRWEWPWHEIQQLTLEAQRIRILTYRDNAWKLGADREYEFRAKDSFESAVPLLTARLDRRFVNTLAAPEERLWELPVKHLHRFGGSHGVLIAGRDRIVYKSNESAESRTWLLRDIENISASGPFQLTINTFEKAFNFQLKEALAEDRYNELWRRLNIR